MNTRTISCQAEAVRKTALVTGANSGIGFVSAMELAKQGYMTVLACRDLQKAQEAKARILQEVPDAKLEPQRIDLSDLTTIRDFTERALAFPGHQLDVLLNNAGVMATPEMQTAQGYEYQLGVNHLAHFLLTQRLMPLLTGSRPSRIINVASSAHQFGHIHFDNINLRGEYSPWKAYGQSKLANILYTYELDRRLRPGDNCTANTLHPGIVGTNLGRYLLPDVPGFLAKPLLKLGSALTKTPDQGAQTSIYLATSPEVANVSGKYFVDCQPKTTTEESYDPEVARRLWDLSAEMVNL